MTGTLSGFLGVIHGQLVFWTRIPVPIMWNLLQFLTYPNSSTHKLKSFHITRRHLRTMAAIFPLCYNLKPWCLDDVVLKCLELWLMTCLCFVTSYETLAHVIGGNLRPCSWAMVTHNRLKNKLYFIPMKWELGLVLRDTWVHLYGNTATLNISNLPGHFYYLDLNFFRHYFYYVIIKYMKG